jgi:toxoflavin biosynthesis protein ToxD
MALELKSLSNLKGKINELSDREAMGLPNNYISTPLENLNRTYEKLMKEELSEIVKILENTQEDLETRFVAGSILALLDDPRIDPLNPHMVEIPGGKVKLGLPYSRVEEVTNRYEETGIISDWIEKESPEYEIDISTFKIAKYPVTNKEYLAFIKENPKAEIPSSWKFGRFPFEYSNHPVYTVSPETADSYAKWLSKKTGRKFRLPSEAEWEYAAAGPNGNAFPWGDEYLNDHANIVETGFLMSSPVGMFPEGNSIFGVADLSGNVEEYVADDYKPYAGGEDINDDLANTVGSYRIARGGGFTRLKDLARCKRRHGHFPRDIYVMGFRLAED